MFLFGSQHDILWPELTAYEHLQLFGKLKNLSGAVLTEEIKHRLAMVQLSNVADHRVGTFSGGMKRRLSVAIGAYKNRAASWWPLVLT